MKQGKKLLSSAVVLVVAIALAVSSTYAWFTMSTEPKIEGLQLNVVSTDGIRLAVTTKGADTPDDEDFKLLLKAADFKDILYDDGEANYELLDVTTLNGKDFYRVSGRSVDEEENVIYSAVAASTGSYLEFDIHFLADTNAYDIVLDVTADGTSVTAENLVEKSIEGLDPVDDAEEIADIMETVIKNAKWWKDENAAANTYGTHGAIAKGDELDTNAANALRISFESKYNNPDYDSEDPESKEFINILEIFEPNHDKGFHKNVDKNLALEYFNYRTNRTAADDEFDLPRNGYKLNVGAETKGEYTNNFDSGEFIYDTFNSETAAPPSVVKLEVRDTYDFYNRVTVRIWIEGWDGDAFDSVLQDTLTINLQFKGVI